MPKLPKEHQPRLAARTGGVACGFYARTPAGTPVPLNTFLQVIGLHQRHLAGGGYCGSAVPTDIYGRAVVLEFG